MGTAPFFADEKAGQSPGFTLVEVLLAVAILGFASLMIAMSFTSTFRVVEAVGNDGDREHVARSCLTLLVQDLLSARLETTTAPFTGRNGEINSQPSDILAFVSAGHSRAQLEVPETEIGRILYVREEGRLVRYEIANPYIMSVVPVAQTELATGVAGFNVRYYDRGGKVWLDTWEGQGRTTLPGAVMVELTLVNARKEPRTYTAYVSFPWQVGT